MRAAMFGLAECPGDIEDGNPTIAQQSLSIFVQEHHVVPFNFMAISRPSSSEILLFLLHDAFRFVAFFQFLRCLSEGNSITGLDGMFCSISIAACRAAGQAIFEAERGHDPVTNSPPVNCLNLQRVPSKSPPFSAKAA